MTSIFLVRDNRVLLLHRQNSRAIADSWVGVGGHLEQAELGDPTAAALRELREEVGLTGDDLDDLRLRYVALRDTGAELRFTYYFAAMLGPDTPAPTECTEGELSWFDLAEDPALDMPPTAGVAFEHWRTIGRFDDVLRSVVLSADGPMVLALAH
jgi:8-oxo-dGTP diphosphatase